MTATADTFARWTRIRRKGPFRFILLRGVLGWGLAAGTLYPLVMWAVTGARLGLTLPFSLVLFPVGGLLWGAVMWWFLERSYHQRPAPLEER